jgi:hypothetical protein
MMFRTSKLREKLQKRKLITRLWNFINKLAAETFLHEIS